MRIFWTKCIFSIKVCKYTVPILGQCLLQGLTPYWINIGPSPILAQSENNLHWEILVYVYITLLFSHPAIFKQIISLKPILGQHNLNNWLILVACRLPICCTNLLYHYWVAIWGQCHKCQWQANVGPYISQQDIANANIANGNPKLIQCGLTRERQRQYRQWETNVGPIYSCCLGWGQW